MNYPKTNIFRGLVAVNKSLSVSRLTGFRKFVHQRIASNNKNRYQDYNDLRYQFNATAIIFAVLLSLRLRDSNETNRTNCKHSDNIVCDVEIGKDIGVPYETGQTVTNWSSTHTCNPATIYEPHSAQEVTRLLSKMSQLKMKIRPVGTALSPNGIGMSSQNLLSVANLDYIEVDKAHQTVTVGAGAKVSDVLKELSKHGLTLENFSSIQEQQMAGWTQVSAHGTGCSLSTVDSMITRMKLATPLNGILTLSPQNNKPLFDMAKVGLGSLGVVTELTLTCIPQFDLEEKSFTTTLAEVNKLHCDRLRDYRHVRHMFVPYTDTVVVVVSNPTTTADRKQQKQAIKPSLPTSKVSPSTQAMVDLLLTINPSFDTTKAQLLSFSQLRDLLLAAGPRDVGLIKRINAAEAAYWARSSGERIADSTDILGFDCGGEQFVFEVCFPIGSIDDNRNALTDLSFAKRLLALIEEHQIAAPSPIEQRWTARSTSPMSPAYSTKADDVFCWVGVIMYLPANQTDAQRKDIRQAFQQYRRVLRPLLDEYKAHCHWAKIELPLLEDSCDSTTAASASSVDVSTNANSSSSESIDVGCSTVKPGQEKGDEELLELDQQELQRMRKWIATGYPKVHEFNAYRRVLDPNGVLSNRLVDELFAQPD